MVLLALVVRAWAALMLPIDADEPVYLDAGHAYAQALRAGDWNAVSDYQGNREHPALVKVLYGVGWLIAGERALWTDALYVARAISAVFGTLAVLVVALFDPFAGGLLAVHTLAVKYTSEAYLEAVPLFTSLLAVWAFVRAKSPRDARFWLSAIALGATAASKFTYFPVIFPLGYLVFAEKKVRWPWLLAYAAVAVAAFVGFDPLLWRDPVGRLADALFFHMQYSQGAHVQSFHYPWYQPLAWISHSVPWHPEVFFYPTIDGAIFILGLFGLYWEWRARRWSVIWLVSGLLFLFVWPTKWPQYAVMLTPLVCLAAPNTVRKVYAWVKEQHDALEWLRAMAIEPPKMFWILSIGFVALVGGGYVVHNVSLFLERLKWQHVTTYTSYLPGNTIYDVLELGPDEVALATDRGVALWSVYSGGDQGGAWETLDNTNSPLPNNRVLTLAADGAGGFWAGTDAGLAHYRAGQWEVFRAVDYGLPGAQVRAVERDSDGRVWIGTDAGVAVYNGAHWTAFAPTDSGLDDGFVSAILCEPRPTGEWVWFGTGGGISVLDTATGTWQYPGATLDWGRGVAALALGADGRVWAGTLGSGLGVWDGQSWAFYRTANSDIPFNTVNAVIETAPGQLWVGSAHPTAPEGAVSFFAGETWKTFKASNSGYSGAEPLVILPLYVTALDADTLWIGTRTIGVDIYQLQR